MYQNSRMFEWNRRRAGRLCVALVTCQVGSACGDPGSVEIPLPLGRATPEPGASTSAVILVEGSGSDAPCALAASLPDAEARQTLLTGSGERLFNDGKTEVECRIRPSAPGDDVDGVFDVELRVSDEALPQFELRGAASLGQTTVLKLAMTMRGNSESVEALCNVEPKTLLPGAAWFPSFMCEGVRYNATPVACQFEGGAIFERCER